MSEIRRVFINIGKITAEFGAIGVIGFVTNIIKLEKLGQLNLFMIHGTKIKND